MRSSSSADVLLPIAVSSENDGSVVNMDGLRQRFSAGAVAPGQARMAWKVLRVLANALDLGGFEYRNIDELRGELDDAMDRNRKRRFHEEKHDGEQHHASRHAQHRGHDGREQGGGGQEGERGRVQGRSLRLSMGMIQLGNLDQDLYIDEVEVINQ